MTKLEQYKYADAIAIALVLLALSFLLMLLINSIQLHMQKFSQGGIHSLRKVTEPHRDEGSRFVKYLFIAICAVFLFVMLVLPLTVVIANAFRDGWKVYRENVLDEYTIKAFRLTLLATVSAVAVNTVFGLFASYLLSKFYFRGRQRSEERRVGKECL